MQNACVSPYIFAVLELRFCRIPKYHCLSLFFFIFLFFFLSLFFYFIFLIELLRILFKHWVEVKNAPDELFRRKTADFSKRYLPPAVSE